MHSTNSLIIYNFINSLIQIKCQTLNTYVYLLYECHAVRSGYVSYFVFACNDLSGCAKGKLSLNNFFLTNLTKFLKIGLKYIKFLFFN